MTDIKDYIDRIREEYEESLFDQFSGMTICNVPQEPTTLTSEDFLAMLDKIAESMKEYEDFYDEYAEGPDGEWYRIKRSHLKNYLYSPYISPFENLK